MSDLNDLRNLVDDDDMGNDMPDAALEAIVAQQTAASQAAAQPRGDGRILGMTAGQRAFVSVVVFFNVLLIGMALLLVTGRLGL